MNLRMLILGSVAVACARQPAPACPVAAGSPLGFPAPSSPLGFSTVRFSLPNFWASYRRKTSTGTCAALPGEEIGFQKFETPNEPTKTTVAIRPFLLSAMRGNPGGYGALEYADFDPSNDDPGSPRPDPVFRVDPMDPGGVAINAIGKLPPKPGTDNLCAVTDTLISRQKFREEVLPLVPGGTASPRGRIDADAGTVTFPELEISYTWSEVKLVSTGEVPGSVFTAQLEYRETGCTDATYDVTGIWPITLCHTDLDCSPYPLPDATDTDIAIPARRSLGSGLNPAFEDATHLLKCNNSPEVHRYIANYAVADSAGNPVYGIADWGVCEMTRPVSDFTAAP